MLFGVKILFRKERKFVDYLLYRQDGTNTPLAIVEAKDNNHDIGAGMQQALDYAEHLDVPFVFTSNGDGFVMHDRTGLTQQVERIIKLKDFPRPTELDVLYRQWRGIDNEEASKLTNSPYHDDANGKNRAIISAWLLTVPLRQLLVAKNEYY